jgi:hypothetical protein
VPVSSTPAGDEGVRAILKIFGPRTRALSWVLFLVYLVFGVSIFSSTTVGHLSSTAFIVTVICATVVLIVGLIAISKIEIMVERGDQDEKRLVLRPSSETPDSALLNGLVNSTLEAICRAASLPDDPKEAGMRAFIFRVEGDQLVCRYYWAQNPTSEAVGVTSFPLTREAAKEVVVVDCVLSKGTKRTAVQPLSSSLSQEKGRVESDLNYVLAAPIWNESMTEVWGTVDFDTSNRLGCERLSSPGADAAIFQLTKHLQVIFNATSAPSKTAKPRPKAKVKAIAS